MQGVFIKQCKIKYFNRKKAKYNQLPIQKNLIQGVNEQGKTSQTSQ